jgi:hypothetical protein
VAEAYLTNESSASAFNIRFGIAIGGVPVHWKHNPLDAKPSRINVLRPNQREPAGTNTAYIAMPDQLIWGIGADRDPDEGRSYWTYYQGPAGDWWYTSNPTDRSADLVIERVRSRRFGALSRRHRKLTKTIERGRTVRTEAIRDLNEAAERMRARRESLDERSDVEPDSVEPGA